MKKFIIAIAGILMAVSGYSQKSITLERADGTKIHTSLENFIEATFTDEAETIINTTPEAPTFEGLQLEAQDINGCEYIALEQIAPHVWVTSRRLTGSGNWWDCSVKIVSSDHRTYWGQPFTQDCTESGKITLVEGEGGTRYLPAGTYGFIYIDTDNSLRFTRLYDKADVTEVTVEKEVYPKSDYTVSYSVGSEDVSAQYLGEGLWRATVTVEPGMKFSLTRTDKEGQAVKWGAATADTPTGLTGSIAEGQAETFALTGVKAGRYTLIFDENYGSFAFMVQVLNAESKTRTLSFEDPDYKGEGNVFATEKPWSGLIDTPQAGGPMLYGSQAGEYQWYDQNNTELRWDGFSDSGYGKAFYSGGYAVSNYVGEPKSDYTQQLAIPFGDGTNNFCMAFNREDKFSSKTVEPIYFADGVARVVRSIDVTNSSYAAGSLMYGDGFAPAAKEGTEFIVNIRGTREDGSEVTVQHHLCKDTDILKDHWETVDCSSMGKVMMIEIFVTGSSDLGGDYGLNTPGYVAFDNIVVEFDD